MKIELRSTFEQSVRIEIIKNDARTIRCCARIIFSKELAGSTQSNVALSVQASHNQQNNRVKHPKTVSLLCLL